MEELLEVAVLRHEHPLEILEGRSEHAVTQAGKLVVLVAVVYEEQNGAASVDDRIIARYGMN
jgi:hypothetical protein